MALVSQNVPHLLDGISQLPANLRKTSEGTAQVNGYDNPGRGKQKRPPVDLVRKLGAVITGLDTAFMHTISRDTTERYHVVIANGDLQVFDVVTGLSQPVSFPNGKTYLTVNPPAPRSVTIPLLSVVNGLALTAFTALGYGFSQQSTPADTNTKFRTFNAGNLSWGFQTSRTAYAFQLPMPQANYKVTHSYQFPAPNDVSDAVSVRVRNQSTTAGDNRGYEFRINGNGQWTVEKIVAAGGGSLLTGGSGTVGGYVIGVPHTIALEGTGSNTFNAYLDGVLLASVVDNSGTPYTAAGYPGIGGNGASDNNGADGVATRVISSQMLIEWQPPTVKAPLDSFRAVTIGDYTFIVNRTATVGKTANLVATRVPEALVFVRQADYSTSYKVNVDGTVLNYTTLDGTNPSSRAGITTDNIAEQLRLAFVASALNATHTCTRTGSTLYIKRINNAEFTVTATDGMADSAILAIKRTIQRFDDLPLRAVNGVLLEITGDPGSLFDNYHVVYDDSGSASGAGVWRETAKPGELYQLDPATMPYTLINTAGTFVFAQAAWRGREVGSLVTNPFGSYVGKKINELFFTQGRLGMTSGENVILSGVADVFNFFRKSAKALYDNDPIDINSAGTKILNWHAVVEWNSKPLLWSDQGQSVLEGEPVLSPKTVRLRPLTSFENQPTVRPTVVGSNVFFAQIINGKTRLSAYSLPQNSELPIATDLTPSVSSFIQGTPLTIVGTDTPGFVAVRTNAALNKLYILSFGADNNSWSRWDLESTSSIIGMDFLAGNLGLLVMRSDGLYLEQISLGKANLLASSGDTLPALFDHSITTTGLAANTPYDLPMSVATNGSEGEVVIFRNDTKAEVTATRPTATTVQTTTNLTGISVTIGIRYSFSYTLSQVQVVNQGRNGPQAETAGKLIVGHIVSRLQDTGYLLVTVTSPEGVIYTYTYSQATPFTSDTLQFPVQADAKFASVVFSNDKGLQCTLTGYDWEGNHVIRSQRR